MASASGLWMFYLSRSSSEMMRARSCRSTPPYFDISAFGASPCRGSLGQFGFLSLSFPLSDPEREVCRALSYCVEVDTSRIWEEYYSPLVKKKKLHSGTSPSCKKMQFLCLLAPLKVRAKKSSLYLCQEIVGFACQMIVPLDKSAILCQNGRNIECQCQKLYHVLFSRLLVSH